MNIHTRSTVTVFRQDPTYTGNVKLMNVGMLFSRFRLEKNHLKPKQERFSEVFVFDS